MLIFIIESIKTNKPLIVNVLCRLFIPLSFHHSNLIYVRFESFRISIVLTHEHPIFDIVITKMFYVWFVIVLMMSIDKYKIRIPQKNRK